jgi:FKBP-type peptidyl-prolyl cis-trans isomerase
MRLALCACALVLIASCKETPPPPVPPAAPTVAVAPKADLSPPADAVATASGLRTKVIKPGTGTEHPQPQDLVEVHVIGWKSDGTVFDDSRQAPVQFPVGEVIRGWGEGLQLMVTGETRRLWIPSALAYGDHPVAQAPAGPVVLEVELLTIIKRPPPLPAPEDLHTPPPASRRTKLGLVYRVLKKGTGSKHPRPDSQVEFHYTGWAADGKMVDSTVTRADPTKLRLQTAGRVWTEALATMVAGEKARFWIPPALAREMGGSSPVAVYDVELLTVR